MVFFELHFRVNLGIQGGNIFDFGVELGEFFEIGIDFIIGDDFGDSLGEDVELLF